MVAQYADLWTTTVSTIDEFKHKSEVLKPHCDTVGRDPAEIRTTAGMFFRDPFDDLDDYLRTAESYAQLGVSLINAGVMPGNADTYRVPG